jgi:hypothetical protein
MIDDEENEKNLQDYRDEANNIKAKYIPKSVLSLEKLFHL